MKLGTSLGKALAPAILLCGCTTAPMTADQNQLIDPFALMKEGYATSDAELVASGYHEDAIVVYNYAQPPETIEGRDAIENSFLAFFKDVPGELIIDFKKSNSDRQDGLLSESGYYRLSLPNGNVLYGSFETLRDPETGLFVRDVSDVASHEAFDQSTAPVMFSSFETAD